MSDNKQTNFTKVVGEVVSNNMDKTIVVRLVRLVKHPKYGKYVKRFTKLLAHDESNVCQIGDKVSIKQVSPISKRKAWELVEVLETQAS